MYSVKVGALICNQKEKKNVIFTVENCKYSTRS